MRYLKIGLFVVIVNIIFSGIYLFTAKKDVNAQFQNAINSGDLNTIEYFLADIVRIEIDGTECCGDLTKVVVLEQSKFGKIKYDFDQGNERIKKLKINFPDYFKGHYIGLSESGNHMSYRFNMKKKVDFISYFFLAVESTNEKAVTTE